MMLSGFFVGLLTRIVWLRQRFGSCYKSDKSRSSLLSGYVFLLITASATVFGASV
jgi:hypothetical protein